MKKLNYLMLVLFGMMLSISFTACSDDDDDKEKEKEEIHNVHYDIWATIGETSGMGSSSAILVKSVNSLDDVNLAIGFQNEGTDVSAKLYQESIIKGKYYYQIPKEKDRFGKYEITNNGIVTVAEVKFADGYTYQDRRYCYAWTADNELVILAANGDKNDVQWTKLNTDNMTITANGSLGLPQFTPDIKTYSTSGLATYRASDNKILYFFCEKAKKSTANGVYVAVIDAKTMKVESTDVNTLCNDMSGTAYGELLQRKMFLDENDNLYLPIQSQIPESEKSTCAYSRIIRIKKGENKFDTNYVGMNSGYNTGKIVTCDYIGNGKALLYMQNPEHTGTSDDNKKGDGWGNNYNCYYAIYDLATMSLTELQYEGKNLPFSAGNFSQRSFVLGSKVFIGTNPENELPTVYIYNTKNGTMTKGAHIAAGYELSRIVYINND